MNCHYKFTHLLVLGNQFFHSVLVFLRFHLILGLHLGHLVLALHLGHLVLALHLDHPSLGALGCGCSEGSSIDLC